MIIIFLVSKINQETTIQLNPKQLLSWLIDQEGSLIIIIFWTNYYNITIRHKQYYFRCLHYRPF